jgi:hypothetical protein
MPCDIQIRVGASFGLEESFQKGRGGEGRETQEVITLHQNVVHVVLFVFVDQWGRTYRHRGRYRVFQRSVKQISLYKLSSPIPIHFASKAAKQTNFIQN